MGQLGNSADPGPLGWPHPGSLTYLQSAADPGWPGLVAWQPGRAARAPTKHMAS